MSRIFRIFGIISLVFAALAFFALINTPLQAVIAAVSLALSGLLLITTGELCDRVSYLEGRLNLSLDRDAESTPAEPQIRCESCGRLYDFDYPKCPHCGHEKAE